MPKAYNLTQAIQTTPEDREALTVNRTLTGVAWGLFFILIGGVWAWNQTTGQDVRALAALGVGVILIGLNLARGAAGLSIGRFSLAIGIIALLFGFGGLVGLNLPLLPLILILIGLFVVAEAAVRR